MPQTWPKEFGMKTSMTAIFVVDLQMQVIKEKLLIELHGTHPRHLGLFWKPSFVAFRRCLAKWVGRHGHGRCGICDGKMHVLGAIIISKCQTPCYAHSMPGRSLCFYYSYEKAPLRMMNGDYASKPGFHQGCLINFSMLAVNSSDLRYGFNSFLSISLWFAQVLAFDTCLGTWGPNDGMESSIKFLDACSVFGVFCDPGKRELFENHGRRMSWK